MSSSSTPSDAYRTVQSATGDGTKPMAIAGRVAKEKERLAGMTDAERAWRRQWLKDQKLTPREPLYYAEESPELLNPIRRAYRWPLDRLVFKTLEPIIGTYRAKVTRIYMGKALMGLFATYLGFYYVKYSLQDWTTKGGWRLIKSRSVMYPGDEGYPHAAQPKTSPRDYNDNGFKDSIFGKKYDNYRKFVENVQLPERAPFSSVLREELAFGETYFRIKKDDDGEEKAE